MKSDANLATEVIVLGRALISIVTVQDAYRKGLYGKRAAWASKKYRGHRMIPINILVELENAGVSA